MGLVTEPHIGPMRETCHILFYSGTAPEKLHKTTDLLAREKARNNPPPPPPQAADCLALSPITYHAGNAFFPSVSVVFFLLWLALLSNKYVPHFKYIREVVPDRPNQMPPLAQHTVPTVGANCKHKWGPKHNSTLCFRLPSSYL